MSSLALCLELDLTCDMTHTVETLRTRSKLKNWINFNLHTETNSVELYSGQRSYIIGHLCTKTKTYWWSPDYEYNTVPLT